MRLPERRFPLRVCPVCNGMSRERLWSQAFEQPSSTRLMDGYEVVICRECGAGFADDIPPQEVFDAYYRDLSKYEVNIESGPLPVEPRFRDMADLIAKFIRGRDARVLEIGSASGGLLAALQDHGFRNLAGVDPSPACVRAAREHYGIEGSAATIFTVPPPETPYDFLILTGVMEHIADTDRAVESLSSLLRSGGRLYLEVPDASRYQARLDAPFQEFSVEHINFFSRTSLGNLMRLRGFRTIETGLTMRPLREATCPCTYGVFEKTGAPGAFVEDLETEGGLRRYIAGCKDEDRRIRDLIRDSLSDGERMLVWGTGTHTQRLLATGGLDPSRIAAFVDSNPKYQKQHLHGVPVLAPEDVRRHTEPILISSASSQRAIHEQIKDQLGLANSVILLYETPGRADDVPPPEPEANHDNHLSRRIQERSIESD
jgi:SAM-dependent methyltransferase